HSSSKRDWSSDVCSSDLVLLNLSGFWVDKPGLSVVCADAPSGLHLDQSPPPRGKDHQPLNRKPALPGKTSAAAGRRPLGPADGPDRKRGGQGAAVAAHGR